NELMVVQICHDARELDGHSQGIHLLHRALHLDKLFQILAEHVLKDHEHAAIHVQNIVNRDQIWVAKRGQVSSFDEENLLSFFILSELIAEHLDGYRSIQ